MKFPRLPLPRSLWARMLLLTLGVILLVQGATVATLSYHRQKFTREVAVELTATTLGTLRAALSQVPAAERADFVHQASNGEWRLWTRSLPAGTRMDRRRPPRHDHARGAPPPPPPFANDIRRNLRDFVEALNERLDDGTRVGLSRGPEPNLFVSLMPDPGDSETGRPPSEWLVIPLDRLSPPVSTPVIAFWAAGMGLLLLLAAAFSWHITRPLTRLAKAADQLALGQPQRVVPSGPTETRILGERFNAMLDALAESSAVRQTLLAGLPHDLKGPLSRMWLRIEMSSDPTFQEGMRKDVQDMQRMIDQFIGFVRGSDPGAYQLAPLALNDWLEEQVSSWETAGCDVRLRQQCRRPLELMADAHALSRLLDNLVTNALNHGAPPVEISLAEDDGHAVLTVDDHGGGISRERRAEALRPFSRLDDARTLTGSVGLGLALAGAIVKAHQGTLALQDAPSGGLRVEVRLPLRAGAAGPDAV
ncbi:sensor histidine kinase [Paracandidimonas soli]|uniref:histidine kinase n=1 Tax=Paracandidimonas soli TaxID=1917182 RepID=A0A4R3V2P1_9BURK|nr:HAMP domain-containing sensor histidine kinase [Paracandidimonas soli]TCU99066.1 two-component system osmolarity sensor histidine kinase EnvZ [Paracandidimonas soli]